MRESELFFFYRSPPQQATGVCSLGGERLPRHVPQFFFPFRLYVSVYICRLLKKKERKENEFTKDDDVKFELVVLSVHQLR